MTAKDLTFRTSSFASASVTAPKSPAAALGQAILAVLAFKIFLALQVGPESFEAMTAALAQGDLAQRLAGAALALDEVSARLAEMLAPWLG